MSNDSRRIQAGTALMQPFSHEVVGADPLAWLHTKAEAGMLLLAHADDGIIWGKVTTSAANAVAFTYPPEKLWRQPKLHATTLLMARLFDEQHEYFLWRVDEGKWQARVLKDDAGEACEFYDEPQILWGTLTTPQADGFVKMTEGAQGMHHAPPIELLIAEQTRQHPLQLPVRHYLCNEDGWLRVVDSRLVKPETKEKFA